MNAALRRVLGATLGVPLALSTIGVAGAASPGHGTGASGSSCRSRIALTFDDGPSHYRPQTLQTLRAKHVPATFFDIGMRVEANPQFAGFEVREGHTVLNHTWSHPNLTELTPAQVRTQVLRTQRVLAKAGAPLPFKLVRPPFGAVDNSVVATLTRLGYNYVAWDVVSVDWDVTTTSQEIRDTIVAGLRPGVVILMHDGPIDSAAGAADEVALPQIIDRARQLGYCFGTLGPTGTVVPNRLPASSTAIPRIIHPVPYLPLGSYSGTKLPPRPYVIVHPRP